jgi:mxaK protein
MRRVHGHVAFAAIAVAFSLVTTAELVRLEHARIVNAAIASGSVPNVHMTMRTSRTLDSSDPAREEHAAEAKVTTSPEARVVHAVALAKVDYDGALAAYKAVIQGRREDLRRIALYDLGNLHLRQALQVGLEDQGQSLPLLELAKQSYRDLLRRDPSDWDARYNLERTLRLAPEDDDDADEDAGPPNPPEHDRSTIADPRMDLP